MRDLLRLLMILTLLASYGLQSTASQRHLHEAGERKDCVACIAHSTPGTPPASAATPVPKVAPPVAISCALASAAKPQLAPSDVSFATSPPLA